jgi:hypothetical protein
MKHLIKEAFYGGKRYAWYRYTKGMEISNLAWYTTSIPDWITPNWRPRSIKAATHILPADAVGIEELPTHNEWGEISP